MAIGIPVEVFGCPDSTEAVCVGELGENTDVVAVLKRHACGHNLGSSATARWFFVKSINLMCSLHALLLLCATYERLPAPVPEVKVVVATCPWSPALVQTATLTETLLPQSQQSTVRRKFAVATSHYYKHTSPDIRVSAIQLASA